jgi:hypothetical protein
MKFRAETSSLFLPQVENFTNELALTLVIAGLLFIAFSKQKIEDELTQKIRLNALYWSILTNYIWYAVFAYLISAAPFEKVKVIQTILSVSGDGVNFWVINLFTPLLIFVLRFYYLIYKGRDEYDVKPIKLLPYKFYRPVGELSTIFMILLSVIYYFFINEEKGGTMFLLLPFTMLIWVFSKEKQEDEYLSAIRLHAMQWAIYINYIILLISSVFFYGVDFLFIMMLNLITIPTIFLIVFHYRLYKIRQTDAEAGKSNLNINLL